MNKLISDVSRTIKVLPVLAAVAAFTSLAPTHAVQAAGAEYSASASVSAKMDYPDERPRCIVIIYQICW